MIQLKVTAVPQQLQSCPTSSSSADHHLLPAVVAVVVVDDVGRELSHGGRPTADRGRTEEGGVSEGGEALGYPHPGWQHSEHHGSGGWLGLGCLGPT